MLHSYRIAPTSGGGEELFEMKLLAIIYNVNNAIRLKCFDTILDRREVRRRVQIGAILFLHEKGRAVEFLVVFVKHANGAFAESQPILVPVELGQHSTA